MCHHRGNTGTSPPENRQTRDRALKFLELRQGNSFGPKLSTGEALLIIGTPAAAIQLTQKRAAPTGHAIAVGNEPGAGCLGHRKAPYLTPGQDQLRLARELRPK